MKSPAGCPFPLHLSGAIELATTLVSEYKGRGPGALTTPPEPLTTPRWRRAMANRGLSLRDRFLQHVEYDPNSGCWLWSAEVNPKGYGMLCVAGKSRRAHRLSWEFANGPIPPGEGYHGTCVLHRCDVRACVNPDHLFLGTNADNVADRNHKRRQARGEKHGKARLTADLVADLRSRFITWTESRKIAAQYGVRAMTVYETARGRMWPDIPCSNPAARFARAPQAEGEG